MTPGRKRLCRDQTCEQEAVTGALFCPEHLSEKRQCTGTVRTRNAETGEVVSERRCRSAAMAGLTTCKAHGGSLPSAKAVSARTGALTLMQQLVKPYQGDLDPVSAFEEEFRRTYARILWLEERISGLDDEQALIWGLTKTEQISATEFSGTNRTYEARVHMFEEMLRWERKHFLELEKVWIKANLGEKKLAVMKNHIAYTYAKVNEAAVALGFDPTDPIVRDKLMQIFGGGNVAPLATILPS